MTKSVEDTEDQQSTKGNKEIEKVDNTTQNSKKNYNKMGDKSPQKEEKPRQRSGKGFTCEVVLLDGEHVNIEVDRNANGSDLFEKVCQHLDLIEKEYFGLQFVDERIQHPLKCWLSPDKTISKQKKRGPWLFDFCLKFYPPDPTQLRESLTRWLVTLQTRRDILSGKLPATFLTQAMLGAYCVQADIGDYDSTEHRGIDYVRNIPFAPNQTEDLLEKIVELHRQHKGQTPDEAELNFLENAKKLSMFGMDLHEAQDVNNIDIMLGVCASGLQVYRDKLRISRFVWPKILKISYKRKHFYIKIRPAEHSRVESTVSFKLKTHRLAKRLWKICVEHHAFFRLREADQPQNNALFPRLGSKFRYSGRTLYQARRSSQNLDRPDPYFERSQPARNTYTAPSNRSRSVDELTNRPDHWKDDMDVVKREPKEGQDGRDRRDHMGQPTVISMLGLPEGMKPVNTEEGGVVEPGADRSMDGKDRRDHKPGDDEAVMKKEEAPNTLALSPSELQRKAKEDEKERKKREKEEEKRRKKEEEEKKKAEKAAAKKGKGKDKAATDPTAEDRTDVKEGKDSTERAPGWAAGSHGHEEGERLRGPDKGEESRDKEAEEQWEPVMMREKEWSAPLKATKEGSDLPWDEENEEDKDRFSTFRDPGKEGDGERWSFAKDKSEPRSPGRDSVDRSRYAPGKDGDTIHRIPEDSAMFAPVGAGLNSPSGDEARDRWLPGEDGKQKNAYLPEEDEVQWGPRVDKRPGEWSPGRDGEDRRRFAPVLDSTDPDRDLWTPGLADGAGWDEKDPKKGRKDAGKDKKGKKGSKKDKDEDKERPLSVEKVPDTTDKKDKKKDKERPLSSEKEPDATDKKDKKKDKERPLSSEKEPDATDKKDKKKDKERPLSSEKEPDATDKKDKKKDKDANKGKKSSFLNKFRKPKDLKSKPGEEEPSSPTSPGATQPGSDAGNEGAGYPGYGAGHVPGLGVGAGDMSGVVGDETWIDNKMAFEEVVPRRKETKDSLKSSVDEVDRTMPFFSPAATSTVGRPAKVPPPVPPKSTSFDDSFSRKDPPTVATESVQYQPDLEEVPVPTKNVPLVQTETRTVTYEREGFPFDNDDDGVLVSARSHSTRMQTIETTTYKTEKDGVQETRVEHKVVLSSADDDFDYDAALADAIRSVTEFNPDMSVERIECVQQIEEELKKK